MALVAIPYIAFAADALNIEEVQVGNEIIRKVTPVYNVEKTTIPTSPTLPQTYPIYSTTSPTIPVPVYKAVIPQETLPVYKAVIEQETLPVYKAEIQQEKLPVYKAVVPNEEVPVYKTTDAVTQPQETLPESGARDFIIPSLGIAILILLIRYWTVSIKKYRQSHYF